MFSTLQNSSMNMTLYTASTCFLILQLLLGLSDKVCAQNASNTSNNCWQEVENILLNSSHHYTPCMFCWHITDFLCFVLQCYKQWISTVFAVIRVVKFPPDDCKNGMPNLGMYPIPVFGIQLELHFAGYERAHLACWRKPPTVVSHILDNNQKPHSCNPCVMFSYIFIADIHSMRNCSCTVVYIGWSDVTYLWSQCYFVDQHVTLCVVKWWRFVTLFE